MKSALVIFFNQSSYVHPFVLKVDRLDGLLSSVNQIETEKRIAHKKQSSKLKLFGEMLQICLETLIVRKT